MNDQNQEPISASNPLESSPGSQPSGASPSAPPTVYGDWREQRRAGRSFAWIGGAILILLGVVFLLQNMGIPVLANWWALFILIPAFWAFVAAWDSYQDNGRLTRGGAGSLAGGTLLTILALVFLLNLNVGLFWPVLLIVGGVVLLVTTLLPA
jgi:hypothetical protein